MLESWISFPCFVATWTDARWGRPAWRRHGPAASGSGPPGASPSPWRGRSGQQAAPGAGGARSRQQVALRSSGAGAGGGPRGRSRGVRGASAWPGGSEARGRGVPGDFAVSPVRGGPPSRNRLDRPRRAPSGAATPHARLSGVTRDAGETWRRGPAGGRVMGVGT